MNRSLKQALSFNQSDPLQLDSSNRISGAMHSKPRLFFKGNQHPIMKHALSIKVSKTVVPSLYPAKQYPSMYHLAFLAFLGSFGV